MVPVLAKESFFSLPDMTQCLPGVGKAPLPVLTLTQHRQGEFKDGRKSVSPGGSLLAQYWPNRQTLCWPDTAVSIEWLTLSQVGFKGGWKSLDPVDKNMFRISFGLLLNPFFHSFCCPLLYYHRKTQIQPYELLCIFYFLIFTCMNKWNWNQLRYMSPLLLFASK